MFSEPHLKFVSFSFRRSSDPISCFVSVTPGGSGQFLDDASYAIRPTKLNGFQQFDSLVRNERERRCRDLDSLERLKITDKPPKILVAARKVDVCLNVATSRLRDGLYLLGTVANGEGEAWLEFMSVLDQCHAA